MAGRKGTKHHASGFIDGMTARLYSLLPHSLLGQCLTDYKRDPTALLPGETRTQGIHTLSARRCRIAQAAEGSRILAAARWLVRLLADCPARLYGLFFLLYGVVCCLIRILQPILSSGSSIDLRGIVYCGVLALAALPFLLTEHSLAGAVGRGRAGYRLTCRLLGIPETRIAYPCRKAPAALFCIAAVLGGGAGVFTIWIHPLIIPICFLAIGLLCIVLSFPETGVALSAFTLPAVWIWENLLYVQAALLLLTWIGYGFKLLLMHRSFRFGRLDAFMMLFGIMLIGGGVFSVDFSLADLRDSLLMAVLLSEYFLIVNLMDTRSALKRCMGGIGAALIVIVLLSIVRLLPENLFGWLTEYRLGAVLIGWIRTGIDYLNTLWSTSYAQFLILMLPWLFVFLLSRRRLLTAVPCIAVIVLCGFLIWQTHSLLGIGAAVLGCLLFVLMYGHRSLTCLVALLPVALAGGGWYIYFHPVSEIISKLDLAVREGTERHLRLWPGVWRMIADYPTGIGLGSTAFQTIYPQYAEPGVSTAVTAGNLYMDLLATLGIPGLAVALAALWLFCCKSLTFLRRCGNRWDRTVINAGLCTVMIFMLLGTLRSIGISIQLFACLILVMGICSSLASISADEQEILSAEQKKGTSESEDTFLWMNS